MSDALGRPPFFDSPEAFQAKVDEYWIHIKGEFRDHVQTDGSITREWLRQPEPPTFAGLAYFLGFESRQSFYDYEEKPAFTYACKRARLMVEKIYEGNLHGTTPTGSIFALKNAGWTDKTQTDVTSGGQKLNNFQVEVVYTKHNDPNNTD